MKVHPYIYVGLLTDSRRSVRGGDQYTHLRVLIEQEFEVKPGELFVTSRKKEVKDGRHLFSAIVYHTTKLSEHKIASMINKNHSTINHARKNIAKWLVNERPFREKVIRVLVEYFNYRFNAEPEVIKVRVKESIEKMIVNEPYKMPKVEVKKPYLPPVYMISPLRMIPCRTESREQEAFATACRSSRHGGSKNEHK